MKGYFVGFLVFLAMDLVIFIWIYNRLVRLRNRVREAWSGVEVQLKRRHDLIPALVNIVKGYASHEQEVLKEVAEERAAAVNAGDAEAAKHSEEQLAIGMGKLVAVIEDYPDLKADQNYRDLVTELVETEDELQYARRYYNGATRDLNNAVESFPSNVVASFFKFQRSVFFEVSSGVERMAPKV